MAQALAKSGYRVVAATPHMVPGTVWMPEVEIIKTQVSRLNQSLALARLKLAIVPGMEIAMDPQIPALLETDGLLCLGGSSCLLIEPPFHQFPQGWQHILFSILATGHKILLAHPERCQPLAARPDLVEEFIHAGVYLQVNWGSFLGHYGRRARQAANQLAWKGWIHCLATDSHHPSNPHFGQIEKAASELAAVIGQDNLRRLTIDNPTNLLRDSPLQSMTITDGMRDKKKKRWWQRW